MCMMGLATILSGCKKSQDKTKEQTEETQTKSVAENIEEVFAHAPEGKEIITYEELIDEMIADAWYMVTEYHLNMGPKDTLERLVHYISRISNIKPSEKKNVVLEYLKNCEDREVIQKKRTLTYHVPYE